MCLSCNSENQPDTVVTERPSRALQFVLCFRCKPTSAICTSLQCRRPHAHDGQMRHVIRNALIQELDIHHLVLVESARHALQLIRAQLELQV